MLATDEDSSTGRVKDILSYMAQRSQRRLSSFSREWQAVPQTMVEIEPTKPAVHCGSGMVMIPGGDYSFQVHGIEIEGGNDSGVDVQYPGETRLGATTRIPSTCSASIWIAPWSRMPNSLSSWCDQLPSQR